MRSLLRALRLPGHLGASAVALVWFVLFRRGRELVFTHHPDVDESGRDVQMGPLVDELCRRGRPPMEVTLVSLAGGLLHNAAVKRRPFLSHAALLSTARVLAWLPGVGRERARDLVGRALLRALRPVAVFLIDESGSGQLLVRAAKALGIRTVGIQHGDFQPENPQYRGGSPTTPVDAFCLWSAWFRERLLAISDIYDEENTCVVGRMRYEEPAPVSRVQDEHVLKVLLVSQARPSFRAEVEPFLRALRAERDSHHDVRLSVRPHPGEDPSTWPAAERSHGPLARALRDAHVVCGVDSSALLEALYQDRPAVALVARERCPGDPARAPGQGVLAPCDEPEELAGLCRRLAAEGPRAARERRELVWGRSDVRAVDAILAAASGSTNALRSVA